MDFPKSCVLYLRSGKNTPDFLEIEMVLSDEKIVHYWVPTMKLETYTRNSIFEKNLLMLLPFYIMRYEKDIHEMSENPEMFQSLLNDYEEIRINLEREIGAKSMETISAQTEALWNQELSVIDLPGAAEQDKIVFYTALYHSFLLPRSLSEDGKYRSPFDGKVHKGISFTDYSIWDTFRATHPLFVLLKPDFAGDLITGLLHAYDEGGWLPKWPNPGYTNCMMGTHSDAIIADAYVKGARLIRKLSDEERRRQNDAIRMAQNGEGKDSISIQKLNLSETYTVGIDLEKALANPKSDFDLVLREGDVLYIPEYVNTVKISGSVMYPNTVVYQKGKNLKFYINQAGGYGNMAKKKKVYVVYMNGTVSRLKARNASAIEPGCEIIVPSKAEKKHMAMAEILGISSTTATIAAMVATMANAFK